MRYVLHGEHGQSLTVQTASSIAGADCIRVYASQRVLSPADDFLFLIDLAIVIACFITSWKRKSSTSFVLAA